MINPCNILVHNDLQTVKPTSSQGLVLSEFNTLFDLECSDFQNNTDGLPIDSPQQTSFDETTIIKLDYQKEESNAAKKMNRSEDPNSLGTMHEMPEFDTDNKDTDSLIPKTGKRHPRDINHTKKINIESLASVKVLYVTMNI